MKGKYLRRFFGLVLSVLLLPGLVTLVSSNSVQAQRRGHRVIIVRPYYHRFYRPWGWGWDYNPYFDYYGEYSHYMFNNSNAAYNEGYEDGLKTGSHDASHRNSYNPERSHYFKESAYGNFTESYRSGFVSGYANGFRS